MIDAAHKLTRFIEQQYDARVIKLHPLASSWKQVYRVERPAGPDWVVRLYPPANGDGSTVAVATQAAILGYLERLAYPAEQVVRATDGSSVTEHDGQQVLMTVYLGPSLQPWQPMLGETSRAEAVESVASFDYTPATLQAWGAALAQLHALPLDGAPPIPVTDERPGPQLARASEHLANIATRVPPDLQAEYSDLFQALQIIDRCEDLPFTLIHGDCGLGNAILLPTNRVALVDWDWAGLGLAVSDVGWLLSCCFVKKQLAIEREAITAVVDGYCHHRSLTAAELDRLPEAIQFHTLKLLAVFFRKRVEQALADDTLIYGAPYAGWRAQYAASTEIAALARVYFERSSSADPVAGRG